MTEHKNTPELRFPEFKEEWKFQKIRKLSSIFKGQIIIKKRFKYKWKSLHFIWRIIY